MFMIRNWLWLGFILLSGTGFAQDDAKTTLRKERAQILNEVNEIQRAYNSTHTVSKEAMVQLTTLNRKIEGQERYIISMSRQPGFFNLEEVQDNDREISRIKKTIGTLRDLYYHPAPPPETKAPVEQPAEPAPQRQYPVLPPQHHNAFPVSSAALTGDFGLYRGQIPYPLDKGSIIQGFGRFKIEGAGPDIVGDNPGYTFSAPVNTPVKAVFEGDVISVSKLSGNFYVVIRHGRYVTAYSNLAGASVVKGSKVKTGQVIGTVGRDDETGYGKLDFILMLDDKNLDPKAWFLPIPQQ
ncbi:murein hydrolase activator EnvC family protein [Niabella drilacis]|uniref:Peptidase family M23 n=1 Tax=Niabella drilacis (strain DSM 25811 / CCM 8410 / CCUG 62505 / LMG 26954 / E90) TaxID=1285928 RepID=A0A1G6SKU9_NIADE|nr:peptidoglycan DD-metalloendopeptidase family protein [Niabella drilacis]SDD17499.1 Peptidase family M23 [Niabella drilacis]